jgi:hypothetical protein
MFPQLIAVLTFRDLLANKTLVVSSPSAHRSSAFISSRIECGGGNFKLRETFLSFYCVFAKVQIPISSGWSVCQGILFLCPERVRRVTAMRVTCEEALLGPGYWRRFRLLHTVSLGAHRRPPTHSHNFLPHFVAFVHVHIICTF